MTAKPKFRAGQIVVVRDDPKDPGRITKIVSGDFCPVKLADGRMYKECEIRPVNRREIGPDTLDKLKGGA